MKKCPWCGQEYPDETSVCAVDQRSLISCDSQPPVPASDFPEAKPDTVVMVQGFLLLLLRYIAAITVSYFVSCAMFFGGMFLFMWAGMPGVVLLFVAVGFCGVFFGSLCLPRSGRLFGSAVLLVLGLCYYAYFQTSLNMLRAENNSFPFVWLVPLAGGGAIAVLLFRKRTPKTLAIKQAANDQVLARIAKPPEDGEFTK